MMGSKLSEKKYVVLLSKANLRMKGVKNDDKIF